MSDTPSGSFTTRRRQLQDGGELSWGGSNGSNAETWSNAIESSTGVAISDDGDVRVGIDVPDSGVSRWTFNNTDTNSSTAIDVWGPNDATIDDVTTGVQGANQTYITNEAYSFDRTNDFIDIPNDFGVFTGDYSIAFWVSPDAIDSTSQRILDLRGEIAISIDISTHNGGVYLNEYNNDTSHNIAVGGTTSQWQHIVFVRDASTGRTAYLNGDSKKSDGYTGGGEQQFLSTSRIGAKGTGGKYFGGDLDDIRFYDKALSDSSVSNLYNTGSINA